MQCAAAVARARTLVVVELLEDGWQVGDDVAHLQFELVDQRIAFPAVPLELLEDAIFPYPFDDKADRSFRRPLRGVRDVARQQPRLPLSDMNVVGPPTICTMKSSPRAMERLLTGGLSRCSCSSIQPRKSITGGMVVIVSSPFAGESPSAGGRRPGFR